MNTIQNHKIVVEQINIEQINKKNLSIVMQINNTETIYTNNPDPKQVLNNYIKNKHDNGYLLYNVKNYIEEGMTKIFFLEFIQNLYNIKTKFINFEDHKCYFNENNFDQNYCVDFF